ncbi:MAG: YedE family putative selenium transporter [Planctomycetota bacterium]
MLRTDATPRQNLIALSLVAAVGVIAALLVAAGNPGNMGLCGACFLRDLAGALGFFQAPAPRIFRPELTGIVMGALLCVLARRRYAARSGSFAASRFMLGVLMAQGALVFLGCPFRMLQRLGGGDLNAWLALPGFVAGVFVATRFERRGYSIGKTSPVTAPIGLWTHFVFLGLLVLFLTGGALSGPGPGNADSPAHAAWSVSLVLGLGAGAILSLTGFCAISAARQLFLPKRRMSLAAGLLILAYAATAFATGNAKWSFDGQPIAHTDLLWNALGLALVGLCGALAGGCPVRQLVMAGEGNGDAFVCVMGLVVGGALAHTLGIASTPAGASDAGRIATLAGLSIALTYAWRTRTAPA